MLSRPAPAEAFHFQAPSSRGAIPTTSNGTTRLAEEAQCWWRKRDAGESSVVATQGKSIL